MKKIEFESEEQVRDFIKDCYMATFENDVFKLELSWERTIEAIKEKGYIKKSELDIARESFIRNSPGIDSDAKNFMAALENEIARLNKVIDDRV